jgi:hypothetical protein
MKKFKNTSKNKFNIPDSQTNIPVAAFMTTAV